MKRQIKRICVVVLVLSMLFLLCFLISGLISLWLEGMWYVVVAMVVFILAVIGVVCLKNT